MKYISTRGRAPDASFSQALLSGLAPDGGLYAPETFPALNVAGLREASYADIATEALAPFVEGALSRADLAEEIRAAYASFSHTAVTPLSQLGPDLWLLELFHGPTLAFKDVAMQILARLMDRELTRKGERLSIVAATSGDTGGAAVEAFAGRAAIDLVVLHPKGRISDVQRRMMTTADAANIANVAVEGTFDDCQAIVKALLGDEALRAEINLGAVNSINWARIMAQSVYYVAASAALGRAAVYAVPTGNFGDAFAGWAAKQMGAMVGGIVVATNANDILDRALTTGEYRPAGVAATLAPAMDIQVASNFERLLFEASGRDPASVRASADALKQGGGYTLPDAALRAVRGVFSSGAADDATITEEIRRTFEETGMLVDPHTAAALSVVRRKRASGGLTGPVVALATAHPAKFPDAVEAACGERPALPPRFHDLFDKPERIETLPNDLAIIREYVRKRAV